MLEDKKDNLIQFKEIQVLRNVTEFPAYQLPNKRMQCNVLNRHDSFLNNFLQI